MKRSEDMGDIPGTAFRKLARSQHLQDVAAAGGAAGWRLCHATFLPREAVVAKLNKVCQRPPCNAARCMLLYLLWVAALQHGIMLGWLAVRGPLHVLQVAALQVKVGIW